MSEFQTPFEFGVPTGSDPAIQPHQINPVWNTGDKLVGNYDVSQLMKLVWEIQTYPVINFPKKVAGQVRDIKKLEDAL